MSSKPYNPRRLFLGTESRSAFEAARLAFSRCPVVARTSIPYPPGTPSPDNEDMILLDRLVFAPLGFAEDLAIEARLDGGVDVFVEIEWGEDAPPVDAIYFGTFAPGSAQFEAAYPGDGYKDPELLLIALAGMLPPLTCETCSAMVSPSLGKDEGDLCPACDGGTLWR